MTRIYLINQSTNKLFNEVCNTNISLCCIFRVPVPELTYIMTLEILLTAFIRQPIQSLTA